MSSPLTFDSAIAWINATFGLSIPTLPFLQSWMAPFAALWDMLVPGPLPKSTQPLPWIISISGSWQPPVGGTVTLENITITVSGTGGGSGGIRSRVKRVVDAIRQGKKRKTPSRQPFPRRDAGARASHPRIHERRSVMASPVPSGTSVSVAATLSLSGQNVTINSGDLAQGLSNLVFSLSNPVTLGSIDSFVDALNSDLGIPLTSSEITGALDAIPHGSTAPAVLNSIYDALQAIVSTNLVLTTLNVNTGAGFFEVGVSFPVQIAITSFLSFNGIGVLVSSGGSPS